MSNTLQSLERRISGAGDLQGVVRSMKALAASSIGQYEKAVESLSDYYRTVELGLAACLRQTPPTASLIAEARPRGGGATGVVIFGSDQGLVGRFNEVVADFAARTLSPLPGKKKIWAVGDRIHALMADSGLPRTKLLSVPASIAAITPFIGQILIEIESAREKDEVEAVYVIHNHPKSGALYEPVCKRLLPLDRFWQENLVAMPWPSKNLPEINGEVAKSLSAFIREYLFVLLFQACAESLASENASRLAAMQRAEKNIVQILEDLNRTFHRIRQESIDEELFEVVAGFEALSSPLPKKTNTVPESVTIRNS